MNKLISIEKLNQKRLAHIKNFGIDKENFIPHPVNLDENLPVSVTLKSKILSVYDQGQIGACTANAICQAYNIVGFGSTFSPSRLYLYFKERLIENNNSSVGLTDSGADAADGLQYISRNGICSEQEWPYIEDNVEIVPPEKCDTDAEYHKLLGIKSLDQNFSSESDYKSKLISVIKSTLNSGYPVLIGVQVYNSFMTATDGIIPMPDIATETLDGGHELLLTGYNDKTFEFVNSWGSSWGIGGFGYFPYDYITDRDLTQEFRYFTSVINTSTTPSQ